MNTLPTNAIQHEILAMTKFNSGEAMVLKNPINLTYYKFGNNTIIGTDGLFIQTYKYEAPSERFRAFGGREFELTMHDGEVVKCNGQWWDGITQTAIDLIDDEIVHVTANSVDDLSNCYVFYGYRALKSSYEKLRDQYDGFVYEYHDYSHILKSFSKQRAKIKHVIGSKKYVIDVNNDLFQYQSINGKTYYRYLTKYDGDINQLR